MKNTILTILLLTLTFFGMSEAFSNDKHEYKKTQPQYLIPTGKIDKISVGANKGGGMVLTIEFTDVDNAETDTSTNYVDITYADNQTWYWNAIVMDSIRAARTDTFTVWIMGYVSDLQVPVRVDTVTVIGGSVINGTLTPSSQYTHWGIMAKRLATGANADVLSTRLYFKLFTKQFDSEPAYDDFMRQLDPYYVPPK